MSAIAGSSRLPLLLASAASLLVIVGLGLLNISYPFVADQTVSLYAAKSIAGGGTLYVNFWDNKMPGLVWFFYTAGRLFGFNETGVHLLEILWMVAFSVVLIVAMRSRLALPASAAVVPIAVVGTFYVAADAFHLAQLEMLVGFPIFLALWCVVQIGRSPWPRAAAFAGSGVFAGVTVVFKLVYAPIFAVFWFVACGYALVRERHTARQILVFMLMPAAAGLALVLGAVALKFRLDGALDELLWTAFVYPPEALRLAPEARYIRLFESSMFFATFNATWLVFVVVAVQQWWYQGRDLFGSLLIAWIIVGVVLILIQRFSWWPYHFLILTTPIGVLAVRGCNAIPQRLFERGQLDRNLRGALITLLLLCASAGLAVPAWQKAAANLSIFYHNEKDATEFKRFVSRTYSDVEKSVRFLKTESARPGRIYVFGTPLYYLLSGRDPALPIIGWPWNYFLDTQWIQIPRQLEQAKPPYIYVSRDDHKLMVARGGGVYDYLQSAYVPLAQDGAGTWYLRIEREPDA